MLPIDSYGVFFVQDTILLILYIGYIIGFFLVLNLAKQSVAYLSPLEILIMLAIILYMKFISIA